MFTATRVHFHWGWYTSFSSNLSKGRPPNSYLKVNTGTTTPYLPHLQLKCKDRLVHTSPRNLLSNCFWQSIHMYCIKAVWQQKTWGVWEKEQKIFLGKIKNKYTNLCNHLSLLSKFLSKRVTISTKGFTYFQNLGFCFFTSIEDHKNIFLSLQVNICKSS